MKYCANKDIDRMIRQLLRQGWSYRNGSKHSRLTHPAGCPTLTVSRTPSDWRSVQNFVRDLRRVEPAVLAGTNSTKQVRESHRASG